MLVTPQTRRNLSQQNAKLKLGVDIRHPSLFESSMWCNNAHTDSKLDLNFNWSHIKHYSLGALIKLCTSNQFGEKKLFPQSVFKGMQLFHFHPFEWLIRQFISSPPPSMFIPPEVIQDNVKICFASVTQCSASVGANWTNVTTHQKQQVSITRWEENMLCSLTQNAKKKTQRCCSRLHTGRGATC